MIDEWLDRTGTLQRMVAAQDSTGGNTPAATTITASFPCAVWSAGSAVSNAFARRDLIGTHVIATNADLGAKANDRVTVAGMSGYFLVIGDGLFANANVGDDTLYTIDCERRTI